MKAKQLKMIVNSLPDDAWVEFFVTGDDDNCYDIASYEVGDFPVRENDELTCNINLKEV